MPSPDNDPNTDQILKVVEHHYFKTLLEQRVAEVTEARLSRWRKQIVAPVLIAASVAGWLGYSDIHNIKSLTDETAKKIEADKNKMEVTLKGAQEQLKEAEGQRKQVADLVEQSRDQLREHAKDVTTSTNLVNEGKAYLNEAKENAKSISAQQAETVREALSNSKDSTTLAVDLAQRALKLVQSAADAEKVISALNDRKAQIEAVNKDVTDAASHVLGVEKQIREDQALRDEMIRARTFAPLILRTNQEVQVDVLDPKDPLGKQKYRIFARADDVKPGFVAMKVRVTELWSGASHPEEALPRLTQNNPYPLKDAPGLAMYVDSIKHQTLSHSFALLHVGAAEGALH